MARSSTHSVLQEIRATLRAMPNVAASLHSTKIMTQKAIAESRELMARIDVVLASKTWSREQTWKARHPAE